MATTAKRALRKMSMLVLGALVLSMTISVFGFLSIRPAYASSYTWVDMRGPGNGDASDLVYDQVRDVLYRSTTSGIWKYQASTWARLGEDPAGRYQGKLAFDEARNILFTGTNSQGVKRCVNPDTAPVWSDLEGIPESYAVYSLAFDAAHNNLYAGTTGNSTWRCATPSATPVWTSIGGGNAGEIVPALSYDPGHDVLYAATRLHGAWRCSNPGFSPSWTDMGGGTLDEYIECMTFDATRDILYTGSDVILRCVSPDTTPTWSKIASFKTDSLAFDTALDIIYAGTYLGGVQRCISPNTSTSWQTINNGLGFNGIGPIAFDPTRNRVYAGTLRNGVSSKNGVWCCTSPDTSPTWTDTGGGVSGYMIASQVCDTNHNIVYVGTYDYGIWRCTSPDTSPVWTKIGTRSELSYHSNLAYDEAHDLLYAGTSSDGVWRCSNPGTSPVWSNTGGGLSDYGVYEMAFDTSGNILYAGTNEYGVWRCSDPGTSPVWSNTGGGVSDLIVNDLVYDPGRDFLYAGTNASIWRCSDPGGSPTWTAIGEQFENNQADFIAFDVTRNVLYAGISSSTWRCSDPGTSPTWTNLSPMLHTSFIIKIAFDDKRNILYSGDQELWSCINPDTSPTWTDTAGQITLGTMCGLAIDTTRNILYVGTDSCGVWRVHSPSTPIYTVNTSITGGHGSAFPPTQTSGAGGNVQAKLIPDPGYRIKSIIDNGETKPVSNPYVVNNLMADHDVTVTFEAIPIYTVTSSVAGGHGSAAPASQDAYEGTDVTVGFTPDPSYLVDSVTDNGVEVAASSPYVIKNIDRDHDVVVFFRTGWPYEFYFAEGYTGPGFDEWLCLMNPGDRETTAHIIYMFTDGSTQQQDLLIGPTTRTTIKVNNEVGPDRDVSIKVGAETPIVVERPMYFNYGGAWSGGHDVIGAPTPATTFYFAEGCTGEGFDEWLCLMNPGGREATAHIVYMFTNGSTKVQDVTIGGTTRTTIKVNQIVGPDKDVSMLVTSDAPIVAERPMYFGLDIGTFEDYGRIVLSGGHDVIGATSPSKTHYFAEGYTGDIFLEFLCLMNPGDKDATANITYMFTDGSIKTSALKLGKTSRNTIYVNDAVGDGKEVSILITSDSPIVAERPMYFFYDFPGHDFNWSGGHDVVGAVAPRQEFFFAEGTTRAIFNEWLCLQNPNSSTTAASITYMFEDGLTQVQEVKLGPTTRKTINVNQLVGAERDVSVHITSDLPIIAERPMYFIYGGLWTGGHDVVGYTP